MTQKLIVMERNTKDELQEAIVNNIVESDNGMRISAISVLETKSKKLEYGELLLPVSKHYEAWVVVEVPENNDKLYGDVMGMTD